MKRNCFILIATFVLPLLCVFLHNGWTVKVVEAEETSPTQMLMPLSELPFEDDLQYAETVMQYAISVGNFSSKLSKWNGECLAVSAGNINRRVWTIHPSKQLSHQLLQLDGRSVIIWLHHLII